MSIAEEVAEEVFGSTEETTEETPAQPERPQREMITLDTPLPPLPENRLPAPDEIAHENKLSAIDNEILILRSKIDNTYSEIKQIMETKSATGESSQAFLADARNSKKLLSENRQKLIGELRDLKRDFYSMIEEQKKIRSKVKVQDFDKLDQAIVQMRRRIETESLSLQEEKRVVQDLKELEASRPFAMQHKERDGLIEQNKKRQSEIQNILDGFDSQRKELDEQFDARKQASQQITAEMPNHIARKEEYKAKIDDLRQKKKDQITDFKVLRKEYNEQQREIKQHKFVKDIQKRIRDRLKREEEWKKREAEREEEDALMNEEEEHYADEISNCRNLISYLQNLLPKSAAAEAPAEETKVNPEVAKQLEQNKLVPMQSKKQLEAQQLASWGGGKGGGKKNKRQRVKKSQTAQANINHPLDSMSKFSALAVKAPATLDDIPATISSLQEKIKYYEELPPPDKPEDIPNPPEEYKASDTLFEEEGPDSFPDPLSSNKNEGYGVFPEEKLAKLEKPTNSDNTRGNSRGRRGDFRRRA